MDIGMLFTVGGCGALLIMSCWHIKAEFLEFFFELLFVSLVALVLSDGGRK